MNTIDKSCGLATVPEGVGDAVGVEKGQWYVAIVKHNTEKNCSERLDKLGIQNYVPVQTEYRVWKNGRKAKVDRVVIPSTVFVRCTEKERLEIVKHPFINRFMTNKAALKTNNLHSPIAVIPDDQIELLKFMLGQSDIPVEIVGEIFHAGDKVRIIRGYLAGLEGEVLDLKNMKSELIVRLDIFGGARLNIDTANLELIIQS